MVEFSASMVSLRMLSGLIDPAVLSKASAFLARIPPGAWSGHGAPGVGLEIQRTSATASAIDISFGVSPTQLRHELPGFTWQEGRHEWPLRPGRSPTALFALLEHSPTYNGSLAWARTLSSDATGGTGGSSSSCPWYSAYGIRA